MDKFTLDSVMEEIKKSLGEARLHKIMEADDDNILDPNKTTDQVRDAIQRRIDARNAPKPAETPSPAPSSSSNERETATNELPKPEISGPVGSARRDMGTPPTKSEPSASDLYKEPGSQANAPKPATPAPAPRTPEVLAKKDDERTQPARPSTLRPNDTSPARPSNPLGDTGPKKIGDFGANAFGNMSPKAAPTNRQGNMGATNQGNMGATNQPKAASPGTKTQGNYAPTNMKTQGNNAPTNMKPQGNFSTNNQSPYGFAKPGSDEDTAANFFASDARMRAAQAAQAASKPSAPKPARPARPAAPKPVARGVQGGAGNVPALAENFDQFVKKFIKEQR
jgi:hypothetical protein